MHRNRLRVVEPRARGKSALVLLGAGALALTAGAWAQAQTPAQTAPKKKAAPHAASAAGHLPDWRGVWAHVGSLNIDPTTDSGKPQPNAPLNAEAKKVYDDGLAARAAGKPRGDIGCLPEGPPRNMRSPYPMEVVVTPQQTWILLEFKHEVRRVYTDGRKPPEDLDPTYEGYSTGHWEGDTLVFDTVGLVPGTIDSGGLAHSDALTLHERMRKVNAKTLEDQITMTDPKIFTKPWTITRQYELHKDWDIKEFVCEQNERNPVNANGQTGLTLKK
jgi:hypothetical protein